MVPFDIDEVITVLKKHKYKEVVLQFVDDQLQHSVEVYHRIQQGLDPAVNLYITADSTWGSSADDISAKHVQGDVLVYFGSDLSSSSSLPVMVVPEIKPASLDAFSALLADFVDPSKHYLIFYEASYYHIALRLLLGRGLSHQVAMLPKEGNLQSWDSADVRSHSAGTCCIGGLFVREEWLLEDNLEVIYIGDKESQLEKIMIRLSAASFLHLSPRDSRVTRVSGADCKTLRERYGGIMRVKDANIIGIIIGSMGLSEFITKAVVDRLEKLIVASKKKFYTFVMGRINEAKLCNFPEVDIFCLIANEDVSMIKPKSFPVPVITPFELELGLGARSWESMLATSLGDLLNDDLAAAIEKVKEEYPYEEDEEESELLDAREYGADQDDLQIISLENLGGDGKVVVFNSAATEYYNNRTFKGLEETIPEAHSTKIHQGHQGIAAGYKMVEEKVLKDLEDL